MKINKEIIASLWTESAEGARQIKALKAEKDRMVKLIQEQGYEISQLNDKWLILEQIKNFHQAAAEEVEAQWEERVSDVVEQLDRKEYVMQVKENKWNEIEKIMTIYSKNDYILREKLAELRYLCDDTSAWRGISSVVKENEILKKQLESSKKEVEGLWNIINEFNKSKDDLSLDEIIEEISNISGGTGSEQFNQPLYKIPKLDLNSIPEVNDKTNYKQLWNDQTEYIQELEEMNKSLIVKNKKLVDYVRSKVSKYKLNIKDNLGRIQFIKKKLEEYEGLNKSVYDVLDTQEKIIQMKGKDAPESPRHSIFSQQSEFGSIIVGGYPKFRKEASFGPDDEVIAATGSSSQHRRAKSKPFLFMQYSNARKLQLEKLERDLEIIDKRRKHSISRMKSDPKLISNNLINDLNRKKPFNIPILNIKQQASDISDIRFPSERRCESPINVDEIFGESFEVERK